MSKQLYRFTEAGLPTEVKLRPEDIRSYEVMHFALSLTALAIFRWSRRHPKSEVSDKVCLEVLKINIESLDASATLSTLVAQLQSRSGAYKAAFLNANSSDSWKQDLAALVSRNVIGQESLVIGSVLSASAAVILEVLNETIDELERD